MRYAIVDNISGEARYCVNADSPVGAVERMEMDLGMEWRDYDILDRHEMQTSGDLHGYRVYVAPEDFCFDGDADDVADAISAMPFAACLIAIPHVGAK